MKKTYVLGISAFYHDSAAALLADGEIIAAAQEERFTRKKHDPSFPVRSIQYCLKEAGITGKDIGVVAFYEKPYHKDKILWHISEALDHNGKIVFFDHHHSHAASAFYPSPFKEAAILTIDGVGGGVTASFGKGKDGRIELHKEIGFPHSLGFFYSAFTEYCGFRVNSDEYKLMGLAAYGQPKYTDIILENLIDLKDNGSFKLNTKYFDLCAGKVKTNENFHRLFGGAPRKAEERIEERHMDLASSAQAITELALMNMAKHVHKETGMKDLCMAGGVALNCVANGKLLKEGPFENIWIQPASSDAGGALGAAFIAWHEHLGKPRKPEKNKDSQKASLLGPSFSDEEIEEYLAKNNISYKEIPKDKIPEAVSDLVAKQNVVGWFQGRMEFGPRALGSRSIIGDARSKNMKSVINEKIKFREDFRPFAPSVLLEKAGEYFDVRCESPYMLFVSSVVGENSRVPAVTHVDNTARIQTIKRDDNPLYYDMIHRFGEDHGSPVILNTSFNVKGEPIVCTPQDAYECFMKTDMDYLVMGSFLIDIGGK